MHIYTYTECFSRDWVYRFHLVFRRVHDNTSITYLNAQEMWSLRIISYSAKGRPGCRGGKISLTTGGGAIHSCILLSVKYDTRLDSGLRFGMPLREIQRSRLAPTWRELEGHVVYPGASRPFVARPFLEL